jgi:solute carrier family 25 phosphate transporter 3
MHSLEYFVLCMIGGILSGLPHTILTPLDHVKCRVQVGEFGSASEGLRAIWANPTVGASGLSSPTTGVSAPPIASPVVSMEGGANCGPNANATSPLFGPPTTTGTVVGGSVGGGSIELGSMVGGGAASTGLVSGGAVAAGGGANGSGAAGVTMGRRFEALYRGWAPTLIGYSLQGAAKFGLYEYFKFAFAAALGPEFARNHSVAMFLAASACAELIADVFLAPWEAVKVKMQTNASVSGLLSVVAPRLFALEGMRGFFKGLAPLWMRQVPYTMTKFATFETIVVFLYTSVLRAPKSEVSPLTQLLVSVVAGFAAGAVCAVVSHPADTVVSRLNQSSDGRTTALSVLRELGPSGVWKGLAARLFMIGTLTALQWLVYDAFKVSVGLPTTGGGHHPPQRHSHLRAAIDEAENAANVNLVIEPILTRAPMRRKRP